MVSMKAKTAKSFDNEQEFTCLISWAGCWRSVREHISRRFFEATGHQAGAVRHCGTESACSMQYFFDKIPGLAPFVGVVMRTTGCGLERKRRKTSQGSWFSVCGDWWRSQGEELDTRGWRVRHPLYAGGGLGASSGAFFARSSARRSDSGRGLAIPRGGGGGGEVSVVLVIVTAIISLFPSVPLSVVVSPRLPSFLSVSLCSRVSPCVSLRFSESHCALSVRFPLCLSLFQVCCVWWLSVLYPCSGVLWRAHAHARALLPVKIVVSILNYFIIRMKWYCSSRCSALSSCNYHELAKVQRSHSRSLKNAPAVVLVVLAWFGRW